MDGVQLMLVLAVMLNYSLLMAESAQTEVDKLILKLSVEG